MFQVIFNEISAAEISQLPILEQLEVGLELPLRHQRASDVRIYFEVLKDHQSVVVHRVLSKNSFQDFLFRANLPVGDDDALSKSKQFWALIEEGERARRV